MAEAIKVVEGSSWSYIDVGANIGLTSIPVAALGVETIAVEPLPDAIDLLAANSERAGLAIRIVSSALTDRATLEAGTGSARLHVQVGNLGASSLLEQWNAGTTTQTVEVSLSTLDDVADLAASPIRLVKIDCEGSEDQVLAGARQTLDQWRPIMLFEWARRYINDPERAFDRIRAIVGPDYEFHTLTCGPRSHTTAPGNSATPLALSPFNPMNDADTVLAVILKEELHARVVDLLTARGSGPPTR